MTGLIAALGHCNLMMDNLQDAYTSYQQALYHLRDPKVGSRSPAAVGIPPKCMTLGAEALVRDWHII